MIDLFFNTESNYRYPSTSSLDAAVNSKLAAAISDEFDVVREAAIADASALLGRASIDLGKSPNGLADLPTDQRVKNARSSGDDVELVTLAWNLGRHMLVGSSRNTAAAVDFPANLQGVWNNATSAPWGGKVCGTICLLFWQFSEQEIIILFLTWHLEVFQTLTNKAPNGDN